MKARHPLAALLAAALLAGCASTPDHERVPVAAADRLPAVTLPSIDGGPSVDLRTYKGPAVVNVWASWCDPCKRELPLYAAYAKAHPDLRVLGVDFQDSRVSAAEAMMRTARVAYPVVTDFDGAMRAIGLPKLLLVDATGKVVFDEYVEIKSAAQLDQIVRAHLPVGS